MALQDMMAEVHGSVPKLPIAYSKTLVNRAWSRVRNSNLWSFNLFVSNWITPPPLIGVGGVTTTQGSPNILFDATATTAINNFQTANPYVLVTQLQFRVGVGDIYSLISYTPGTGAAVLDRPFADPSVADLSFQLYQLYYPVPFKDFLTWLSIRNPQMFLSFDLTRTRSWLDSVDPQRTWYQFPTKAVAFGIDTRGQGTINQSATLGFQLYELWGQPVTPFTYACYGIRKGSDLAAPTDTLPVQVGEDLVVAKAREYAYEWAEANKAMAPRAVGPNFQFLIAECRQIYKELLIQYRRQDKEFVDSYCATVGQPFATVAGIYNTIAGVASPYAPW